MKTSQPQPCAIAALSCMPALLNLSFVWLQIQFKFVISQSDWRLIVEELNWKLQYDIFFCQHKSWPPNCQAKIQTHHLSVLFLESIGEAMAWSGRSRQWWRVKVLVWPGWENEHASTALLISTSLSDVVGDDLLLEHSSKKEPQCRISALSLSHTPHTECVDLCRNFKNASIVRCIGKKPICLPRVVSVPDNAPGRGNRVGLQLPGGSSTVCHFLWGQSHKAARRPFQRIIQQFLQQFWAGIFLSQRQSAGHQPSKSLSISRYSIQIQQTFHYIKFWHQKFIRESVPNGCPALSAWFLKCYSRSCTWKHSLKPSSKLILAAHLRKSGIDLSSY